MSLQKKTHIVITKISIGIFLIPWKTAKLIQNSYVRIVESNSLAVEWVTKLEISRNNGAFSYVLQKSVSPTSLLSWFLRVQKSEFE